MSSDKKNYREELTVSTEIYFGQNQINIKGTDVAFVWKGCTVFWQKKIGWELDKNTHTKIGKSSKEGGKDCVILKDLR